MPVPMPTLHVLPAAQVGAGALVSSLSVAAEHPGSIPLSIRVSPSSSMPFEHCGAVQQPFVLRLIPSTAQPFAPPQTPLPPVQSACETEQNAGDAHVGTGGGGGGGGVVQQPFVP